MSLKGHKNFNKIHIRALLEEGCVLDLVGKYGQFDGIDKSSNVCVHAIPSFLTKKYPFPSLSCRIEWILILIWSLFKFPPRNYDIVVMPTYDMLSTIFYRIKKKVVCVVHDATYLDKKINCWAANILPLNYCFIGLNEEIRNRIAEKIIHHKIYHIPHGLITPSEVTKKPAYLESGTSFFFCPINSFIDYNITSDVFTSQKLYDFLENTNSFIVVKNGVIAKSNSDRFIIIDNRPEKDEYDYMMQNAKAVILPYDASFRFRCSGIFFESIARNTPVIATNIDSLRVYKNDTDTVFFSNVNELINGLAFYYEGKHNISNFSKFNPKEGWNKVINDRF